MIRSEFSPWWIFLLRSSSSVILFPLKRAVVPSFLASERWQIGNTGPNLGVPLKAFPRSPGIPPALAVTVLSGNGTTVKYPSLSLLRPHSCASATSGPQIKASAIFKNGFLSFRSGTSTYRKHDVFYILRLEVSLLSPFYC